MFIKKRSKATGTRICYLYGSNFQTSLSYTYMHLLLHFWKQFCTTRSLTSMICFFFSSSNYFFVASAFFANFSSQIRNAKRERASRQYFSRNLLRTLPVRFLRRKPRPYRPLAFTVSRFLIKVHPLQKIQIQGCGLNLNGMSDS